MQPPEPIYGDADLDVEPESDPPPADPEVRDALDRMEDERRIPDAEESAERDLDEEDVTEEQTEDEAPTG
jgi:hypothetical protein